MTHDWREEAWQCYLASGADPDGGDAGSLDPFDALKAVRDLRRDYDAASGLSGLSDEEIHYLIDALNGLDCRDIMLEESTEAKLRAELLAREGEE